jgi:prepilin-type N-terminal cleavage/methylation domain-containing protein
MTKDEKFRKVIGLRSLVFSLDKGFTLVEVLLAVVVLSIGVVAVLQAYAASLAVLQAAQTTMTSVGLLNQKAGEVQQAVFEKTEIEQAGAEGEFESPFEDFAWSWEIKPADMEGLHELTVMVTNLLDARAVSVKTYIIGKKEEEGQ